MRDCQIRDSYQIHFILEYCEKIQRNLERIHYNKAIFDDEYERQDLLSFYLLQIGEHANNLSEGMRLETDAQIHWKQIRGMRNRIAHAYEGVNMQIVWAIVVEEIPALRQFCESYLQKYPVYKAVEEEDDF